MQKKAFLVGINNYSLPSAALRGCINDIDSLENLLSEQFKFDTIIKITDAKATKAAIKEGLQALIAGSSPGDNLVFAFSGHGTLTTKNGAGTDAGKDNALVTYIAKVEELISDDELYSIITSRGEDYLKTINFTGIFDCCHSGTISRVFDIDLETGEFVDILNRVLIFPQIEELPDMKEIRMGTHNIFSACLDDETAADLKVNGTYRGAFSYALHDIIRANAKIRIADLDAQVLEVIKSISKHTQNPAYECPDTTKRIFQDL